VGCRLYYLLGERTRQDHLEMEGKVRLARATKDDAVEDHATLTQMMHDMRAAKEEAERQLAQMKKILEDAKKDWMKKMKDRKKEVQELKRRQEREELKELKRCVAGVSFRVPSGTVPRVVVLCPFANHVDLDIRVNVFVPSCLLQLGTTVCDLRLRGEHE